MKKFCITFLLAGIIILTALIGTSLSAEALSKNGTVTAEYLRIHIRADSNEEAAQNVKYEIRDVVVDFLIPVLAVTHDKKQAEQAIRKNLAGIEETAEKVLEK
ncbi:MAG: stage II sporulation protein R, partial [Candidatus Scatosoma sp.]